MLSSCHGLSSWPARVIAGLGLCLIVTTAFADDARKPASRAKATAAAPVATAIPVASSSSVSSSNTPAPRVICVTSVQCFSVKPTTGSTHQSSQLDLRAPDIHRVFSEAELQQKLQPPDEPQEYEIQETRVEGERQLTPVSIGILAIPWAIVHPTQAWRIFTPMTDAK
jgi:hypothetical protein